MQSHVHDFFYYEKISYLRRSINMNKHMKKILRLCTAGISILAVLCNCEEAGNDELAVASDNPGACVSDESDAFDSYYTKCETFINKLLDYSNAEGTGTVFQLPLPEIGVLDELDIELSEGDTIEFSDMSTDDQRRFIHEALKYISTLQRQKNVQLKSADISNQLRKSGEFLDFASELADAYIKDEKSITEIIDALWTKYGEPNVDNVKDVIDFWSSFFSQTKGIVDVGLAPRKLTWPEFIERVGGTAQKGDLFIVLPIHNRPITLFNINGAGHHQFGHCAMCIEDFTPDTQENQKIIMGAIEEGVTIEPSSMWFFEFYVLEIQKFHYKWNSNATISPLEVTATSLSADERNSFVEFGKQYLGSPFIDQTSAIDWVASKTVAPGRFTCAAYIWYCTKEVLGIDVSIPILPTVAPSHIICAPNIRIKKIIQ